MNKARFCGKITKLTVTEGKNNPDCLILNAGIKAGTTMEFVQMIGVKRKEMTIKMKDEDDIVVAWDQRFDEDVVEKVPYYRKTIIDFGEKKEFIFSYDAIKYIQEKYEDIKDVNIQVRCSIQKNVYNGKIRDRFNIQSMFLANEEKPKMRCNIEFYWNKDCIDTDDWDDQKIITVNGYIQDYDSETKTRKYFPQKIVFNCSKIDFSDEAQKKMAQYRYKRLVIKDKTFQRDEIECAYISGAEEQADWTINDLSDAQKEMVELGMKKVEDFKPKGSIYGDFIREYRVIDFPTMGDYESGKVDTELSEDEFMEDVYHEKVKSLDDFETISDKEQKDLEDLFI